MRILPTRGSPSGFQLLRRIGLEGAATVVCDRWSAYGTLRHILPGDVDLAYCRAHQRCDFRRVGTGFPSLREWADAWIERIGALFHLAWHPERPLERQDAGFQALQQQLESALEDLFRTARRELQQVAPGWLQADASGKGRALALAAARGKALHSLLTHQTGLSVFATDPRVPPDKHVPGHILKSIFWSAGRQTDAGSERRRPLAAPVTKKCVGLNRRPMPCLWGLLGRQGLLGAPAAADAAREGRTGTPRGGQWALAEGPGTPRPPGRRQAGHCHNGSP